MKEKKVEEFKNKINDDINNFNIIDELDKKERKKNQAQRNLHKKKKKKTQKHKQMKRINQKKIIKGRRQKKKRKLQ